MNTTVTHGQLNTFTLVELLQQHRGMCSASLAGESSFSDRIRDRAAEIDRLLPWLSPTTGRGALPVDDLIGRWQTLAQPGETDTSVSNFARHTAFIARLLHHLRTAGADTPRPGVAPEARFLWGNVWLRLPVLTELLGQLRGLGTTAMAAHHFDPSTRVRLMFLLARAESLFGQASQPGLRRHQPRGAALSLSQLGWTVRTRLLSGEKTHLSAQHFFEQGSAAIRPVFAWIRDIGASLNEEYPDDPMG